jgi:hypothetical protein
LHPFFAPKGKQAALARKDGVGGVDTDKDVFWVKFLLKFIEKGYIIKEKRERDLLLLDAETRYNDFLCEFPGIDQRIKQGIIASYLGIKPETLSRIRKKITF